MTKLVIVLETLVTMSRTLSPAKVKNRLEGGRRQLREQLSRVVARGSVRQEVKSLRERGRQLPSTASGAAGRTWCSGTGTDTVTAAPESLATKPPGSLAVANLVVGNNPIYFV